MVTGDLGRDGGCVCVECWQERSRGGGCFSGGTRASGGKAWTEIFSFNDGTRSRQQGVAQAGWRCGTWNVALSTWHRDETQTGSQPDQIMHIIQVSPPVLSSASWPSCPPCNCCSFVWDNAFLCLATSVQILQENGAVLFCVEIDLYLYRQIFIYLLVHMPIEKGLHDCMSCTTDCVVFWSCLLACLRIANCARFLPTYLDLDFICSRSFTHSHSIHHSQISVFIGPVCHAVCPTRNWTMQCTQKEETISFSCLSVCLLVYFPDFRLSRGG